MVPLVWNVWRGREGQGIRQAGARSDPEALKSRLGGTCRMCGLEGSLWLQSGGQAGRPVSRLGKSSRQEM